MKKKSHVNFNYQISIQYNLKTSNLIISKMNAYLIMFNNENTNETTVAFNLFLAVWIFSLAFIGIGMVITQ